jgi:hypothetical protein
VNNSSAATATSLDERGVVELVRTAFQLEGVPLDALQRLLDIIDRLAPKP